MVELENHGLAKEEPEPLDQTRLEIPAGNLDPGRRLVFAGWILSVIAVFVTAASVGYALCPGEATEAVFEFVKVGLLPLVVLIVTFYFQRDGTGHVGQ